MKKMNFFRRIFAKTPEKNRVIGILATSLTTVLITIDQTGELNNKPVLKAACQIGAAIFGTVTIYQAQKIEENPFNK